MDLPLWRRVSEAPQMEGVREAYGEIVIDINRNADAGQCIR